MKYDYHDNFLYFKKKISDINPEIKYSVFQVYSDDEIESVLLAYINQTATLYHIPSLGQQVDIMITYLGIVYNVKIICKKAR